MYYFENVKTCNESISKCTALLKEVFPKMKGLSNEYIRWQYADNPCGQIVGFNALYDEKIVAHYVAQPFTARINGEIKKGLLSLNTATHPDHQGKKLFITLAEKTYEYAFNQGYTFVIGVANANSTYGFLHKLDFKHLAPLTVKLGIGEIYRSLQEKPFSFQHVWDANTFEWRLKNPRCSYTITKEKVYTSANKLGCKALMGFFNNDIISQLSEISYRLFRPITLYLGFDSSINWKQSRYFDLPSRLKPSPLNLIFRDLSGNHITLDTKNISFQALDFDAY